MEGVRMRVCLRFHKTPSEVAQLPYSELAWMFAAVQYADEKMRELKEDG